MRIDLNKVAIAIAIVLILMISTVWAIVRVNYQAPQSIERVPITEPIKLFPDLNGKS